MKWIKVEDEPPPTGVPLLFYAGRIIFGEYVYCGDKGGSRYQWCEDNVGYVDEVTHWRRLPCRPEDEKYWMPFPAIPKEKEQQQKQGKENPWIIAELLTMIRILQENAKAADARITQLEEDQFKVSDALKMFK